MADKTELNLARIRAYDEDIWRTIRGAKVLIDKGSGEIKGGAGGKLNGQKFKPSFGRSLKTGKKVLLPSIHTNFSHHKGSKTELLQRLKKSVTKTYTRADGKIASAISDLKNAGPGTKIKAHHVSPLGMSDSTYTVVEKGGRSYMKNDATGRMYVFTPANIKKYFQNAHTLEISGLTSGNKNANMPQKSVLETKAIKKPNYTRSRVDTISRYHLTNLARQLPVPSLSGLTEDKLRNEVRKSLVQISRSSYPGMPMDKFKASKPEDVINALWRRNRKPKNPLLHKTALQQVVTAMDLDKPPTVLPAKDFEKYVKDNNLPVMYRSVGSSTGFNSYGLSGKDLTNGFRYDNNAWIGEGIYGDGHYFAEDWNESRGYGENTIKAAIDPKKAKIFDYRNTDINVPPGVINDDTEFSVWCLQQGYNVIYIEGGNYQTKGHDFWCVLDRSCLIVSEDDANDPRKH